MSNPIPDNKQWNRRCRKVRGSLQGLRWVVAALVLLTAHQANALSFADDIDWSILFVILSALSSAFVLGGTAAFLILDAPWYAPPSPLVRRSANVFSGIVGAAMVLLISGRGTTFLWMMVAVGFPVALWFWVVVRAVERPNERPWRLAFAALGMMTFPLWFVCSVVSIFI